MDEEGKGEGGEGWWYSAAETGWTWHNNRDDLRQSTILSKGGEGGRISIQCCFFENNNNNRKKPAKNLPNTQNILSANGHSKQKYSYQLWAGHTLHIEAQTTQSNHHDNKASHLSHESHFHQMAVHKPHTQNVLDATSGLGLWHMTENKAINLKIY